MLDWAMTMIFVVPVNQLLDQVFSERSLIVNLLFQLGIADRHPFIDRARELPNFDLGTKNYVRGRHIIREIKLPSSHRPLVTANPNHSNVPLSDCRFFQKSGSHIGKRTKKSHEERQ